MQEVIFIDAALIDYKAAWDLQEKLFEEIVGIKRANRELPADKQQPAKHYLIFCEHPHVYTLGKSGKEDHLLLSAEMLKEKNASFYKINRGGDITYHGPGQLVGYPILDLDYFFTDIHKYLRLLEEAIIRTLCDYGLEAGRYPGYTGVWLDPDYPSKARKICAMGVRSSRWVTMHGFALNINTDILYFNNIIPCGIQDKAVTSMQLELGKAIEPEQVKDRLKKHFAELFGAVLVENSPSL